MSNTHVALEISQMERGGQEGPQVYLALEDTCALVGRGAGGKRNWPPDSRLNVVNGIGVHLLLISWGGGGHVYCLSEFQGRQQISVFYDSAKTHDRRSRSGYQVQSLTIGRADDQPNRNRRAPCVGQL